MSARTIERRRPILEMLHEVCGNQGEPLVGTDQCLDTAPFALEAFLFTRRLVLSQVRDLLIRVDAGAMAQRFAARAPDSINVGQPDFGTLLDR